MKGNGDEILEKRQKVRLEKWNVLHLACIFPKKYYEKICEADWIHLFKSLQSPSRNIKSVFKWFCWRSWKKNTKD